MNQNRLKLKSQKLAQLIYLYNYDNLARLETMVTLAMEARDLGNADIRYKSLSYKVLRKMPQLELILERRKHRKTVENDRMRFIYDL